MMNANESKVAAPVGGHTPGPWFADKPFYSIDLRQRVTPIYAHDADRSNGLWLVAWCHHEAVPAKQRMHNARLIAAAPELLEACQTFAEWLRREDEGLPAGIERGTPEGEREWRAWFDENLRICALAQEQARAALAKAGGES